MFDFLFRKLWIIIWLNLISCNIIFAQASIFEVSNMHLVYGFLIIKGQPLALLYMGFKTSLSVLRFKEIKSIYTAANKRVA